MQQKTLFPPSNSSGLIPRDTLLLFSLCVMLRLLPIENAQGEEELSFKMLYYQEADDRIRVLSPAVHYKTEINPTLTLKIEGIYNTISGASPTGAPPRQKTRVRTITETIAIPRVTSVSTTPATSVASHDDDDEHEEEHELGGLVARRFFAGVAGASGGGGAVSSGGGSSSRSSSGGGVTTRTRQVEEPIPGAFEIPQAQVDDTRIGLNIGLDKRITDYLVGTQVSYSEESDYTSIAGALTLARELNQKNTTLQAGLAVTHDSIDVFTQGSTETKDTVDILVGISQVVNAKTLLTANLTLSSVSGFMADPYKIVEVNGELRPEERPGGKDKQILFLSLTRYLESFHASIEPSYRFYTDTYGVTAHTAGLAWYQKLSEHVTLRPQVRYYTQSAADFYQVRFTGAPEYYSSDYRLSDLNTLSAGLKLIVQAGNWLFDASYDRYTMEGNDGETHKDVYPSADMVMVGLRRTF